MPTVVTRLGAVLGLMGANRVEPSTKARIAVAVLAFHWGLSTMRKRGCDAIFDWGPNWASG